MQHSFKFFFFARFVIFVWLMKPKRVQRSFAFFYKERKRTQRTPCSFIKNVKERRECFVLLKRTQKNARMLRSFEKNGCPTLLVYEVAGTSTWWAGFWSRSRLEPGYLAWARAVTLAWLQLHLKYLFNNSRKLHGTQHHLMSFLT